MITTVEEKTLVEAVRPVDVGVDAQSVRLIDEAEQISRAPAGALKVKGSIEIVSAAECLVQA